MDNNFLLSSIGEMDTSYIVIALIVIAILWISNHRVEMRYFEVYPLIE